MKEQHSSMGPQLLLVEQWSWALVVWGVHELRAGSRKECGTQVSDTRDTEMPPGLIPLPSGLPVPEA